MISWLWLTIQEHMSRQRECHTWPSTNTWLIDNIYTWSSPLILLRNNHFRHFYPSLLFFFLPKHSFLLILFISCYNTFISLVDFFLSFVIILFLKQLIIIFIRDIYLDYILFITNLIKVIFSLRMFTWTALKLNLIYKNLTKVKLVKLLMIMVTWIILWLSFLYK